MKMMDGYENFEEMIAKFARKGIADQREADVFSFFMEQKTITQMLMEFKKQLTDEEGNPVEITDPRIELHVNGKDAAIVVRCIAFMRDEMTRQRKLAGMELTEILSRCRKTIESGCVCPPEGGQGGYAEA